MAAIIQSSMKLTAMRTISSIPLIVVFLEGSSCCTRPAEKRVWQNTLSLHIVSMVMLC